MVPKHSIAYIGLGANLGDRAAFLRRAFEALAVLPQTTLLAASPLYESAPLGAGGGDYLNAVAQLRTSLDPEALLDALLAIESQHGRERSYPNAPRTLDLDLLLHGDVELATPRLVLPHPRLHERAFVLAPLADIAPTLGLPGRGRVDALLRALPAQPLRLWAPT